MKKKTKKKKSKDLPPMAPPPPLDQVNEPAPGSGVPDASSAAPDWREFCQLGIEAFTLEIKAKTEQLSLFALNRKHLEREHEVKVKQWEARTEAIEFLKKNPEKIIQHFMEGEDAGKIAKIAGKVGGLLQRRRKKS